MRQTNIVVAQVWTLLPKKMQW